MSYYSDQFETDWTAAAVDREEVTRRAYAIGVAEKLGEDNRRELEALYEALESAYARSLVELAYQEGRQEATAALSDGEDDAVWEALVGTQTTTVEPPDHLTEGRDGLPEAIGIGELFARMDAGSTEALDRPEFLDR